MATSRDVLSTCASASTSASLHPDAGQWMEERKKLIGSSWPAFSKPTPENQKSPEPPSQPVVSVPIPRPGPESSLVRSLFDSSSIPLRSLFLCRATPLRSCILTCDQQGDPFFFIVLSLPHRCRCTPERTASPGDKHRLLYPVARSRNTKALPTKQTVTKPTQLGRSVIHRTRRPLLREISHDNAV